MSMLVEISNGSETSLISTEGIDRTERQLAVGRFGTVKAGYPEMLGARRVNRAPKRGDLGATRWIDRRAPLRLLGRERWPARQASQRGRAATRPLTEPAARQPPASQTPTTWASASSLSGRIVPWPSTWTADHHFALRWARIAAVLLAGLAMLGPGLLFLLDPDSHLYIQVFGTAILCILAIAARRPAATLNSGPLRYGDRARSGTL